VIERKTGPLYYARNQMLGALRCIFEPQSITKRKVENILPVTSLGIGNVGDWIEFWAYWSSENTELISSKILSYLHKATHLCMRGDDIEEFGLVFEKAVYLCKEKHKFPIIIMPVKNVWFSTCRDISSRAKYSIREHTEKK
jgi:hypothetical protein